MLAHFLKNCIEIAAIGQASATRAQSHFITVDKLREFWTQYFPVCDQNKTSKQTLIKKIEERLIFSRKRLAILLQQNGYFRS